MRSNVLLTAIIITITFFLFNPYLNPQELIMNITRFSHKIRDRAFFQHSQIGRAHCFLPMNNQKKQINQFPKLLGIVLFAIKHKNLGVEVEELSLKFVMDFTGLKCVMLLHLYPLPKYRHLNFILTNIVPEVRWKIGLKSNNLIYLRSRTSTQTFDSNQLRLWLSSMAYVLMQANPSKLFKKNL